LINTVTLVGRLVQDPVVKEVTGGKNVCEVKMALTRPFKNSQNQYDTDFIKIVFWEYLALNLNEYCKKGSIIGVKARLQARSIKIGETFLDVIDVIAEHIVFIGNSLKKIDSKTDEKIEDIPLEELDEIK